jgi:hypothetical protein
MAIFEVQGPDGKIYEVDAPSMEAAAEAIGSFGDMPKGGVSANPEGIADFQNRGLVFGANAANAASFGLGDEAMGLKAGITSMMSGGDYLPAYQKERDAVRGDMATINEAYPTMATAGNLTGAMLPAITASPLATGQSMLGTMGRSLGLGAAEGSLQGAGNADGRDIVAETIKGMLIGGGMGLAAPAAVGGATMAKNLVTEGLPSLMGRAVKTKANRAVSGALQRSGKTAADVDALVAAARASGQPEFRMVDALGLPGQRMVNGIARAGGAPGDEVADFLATRQAGQPERVGAFVEDAFGVGGTTAKKTQDALKASRTADANTAYDAARGNAAPVNLNDTIDMIDSLTKRDPILGESALADTVIGKRLKALRAQMATGDQQLIDFDSVLNIKQDMFATMEGLRKSGKTVPKELSDVYGALDAALEGSSDMYRTANDGFRQASKVIEAVDEGSMMATRGRAADNVPKFGAMAAAERDAARTGYGDRLLAQLEQMTAPTANRAKPLQSPKRVAEADAMTLDPKLYADRLARENTMWETQNLALNGSRTADNLADQGAMDGFVGGAGEAIKSGANLQFGDMVSRVAATLGPMLKGQNEATRALIAQALLSGNPAQVLAPALKQSAKSATVRRILEGMIRQPMREGGEALYQ